MLIVQCFPLIQRCSMHLLGYLNPQPNVSWCIKVYARNNCHFLAVIRSQYSTEKWRDAYVSPQLWIRMHDAHIHHLISSIVCWIFFYNSSCDYRFPCVNPNHILSSLFLLMLFFCDDENKTWLTPSSRDQEIRLFFRGKKNVTKRADL